MPVLEPSEFAGSVADGYGGRYPQQGLRDYLCCIMGEDFFGLCEKFFQSIWNSGAAYKVFMARRCMNLMDMFYRCADESARNRRLEDTFYSDQALLANASEIAEFYEKNGFMPRIVIADEILIHGRTFNGFIMEFIEKIRQCLSKDGADPARDKDKVEADVLRAISIRVIMQNSKPSLLYGRIAGLVRAEDACDMKRRHQFSSCVSAAIMGGPVVNTSFVPSLRIGYDDGENGQERLEHIARQADVWMTVSPYYGRFLKKAWARLLVTPVGDVKAIYTLRVVTSEADRSWTVVPFVIVSGTGDFKKDFFDCLGGDVREDAQNSFRYWGDGSSALIETLVMILSQNLLLLLLEGSGTEGFRTHVDYDKIKMSFRSRTKVAEPFYEKIAGRETPWFSWEQMDRLILKVTEHSRPLYSIREGGMADASNLVADAETGKRIEDAAGNIIASYGCEAEYHAYRQSMREEFRTGRHMPPKPLADVLAELRKKTEQKMPGISEKEFLTCAATVLLRFMDTGALAMAASDRGTDGAIYQICCRACEESLSILPQRYADCIPALAMLERDSIGDFNLFIHEIRKFFSSRMDPQRVEGLVDFVKRLYGMGHRVRDWDIDLTGWSEWVREGSADDGPTLDPEVIRLRDERAVITQMADQSRLAYQYLTLPHV